MPSPFPGMDPYLEAHWRDIHLSLITYTRDTLQRVLPGSLRARAEERVVLATSEGLDCGGLNPFVRVVEYRLPHAPPPRRETGTGAAAPLLVDTAVPSVVERYLQIIDTESGNRVVTIIEYLSPTNKLPGPNRKQYLRKQREICRSDTNLVEINLNRAGRHTLAVPVVNIPIPQRTPYLVCVRRVGQPGRAEVYPVPLQDRLPAIMVPLRPTDKDVPLDLQPLVEACYRDGGYEGTLNYGADPDPPLTGADAEWANALLGEKGLRPCKKPGRSKRKPAE